MPKGYWVHPCPLDLRQAEAGCAGCPTAVQALGLKYLARSTAANAYEAGLKDQLHNLKSQASSRQHSLQPGLPGRH